MVIVKKSVKKKKPAKKKVSKAAKPKAEKPAKKTTKTKAEKPKTEKVEKAKVEETKTEKTEKPKRERTGNLKRNHDKYELNGNGEKLGKGKLVLAMVKQFMFDKPKTTFEELGRAFPAELQAGYKGVFAKVVDVKKNDLAKRYFMHDQIIKTSDGIAVTVTREFGSGNIAAVLEHAKKMGFKIKVHQEG